MGELVDHGVDVDRFHVQGMPFQHGPMAVDDFVGEGDPRLDVREDLVGFGFPGTGAHALERLRIEHERAPGLRRPNG